MELTSQISAAVADLRRATSAGALGDAAERLPGVLTDASIMQDGARFVPSSNPLAVAIDGQGFFVFEDAGARQYGRLGDFSVNERGALVGAQGRTLIGYSIRSDGTEGAAAPIQVAPQDVSSKRFASFTIDESGVLRGVKRRTRGGNTHDEIPIARLALAMFQAPERLQRISETNAIPTRLSGPAVLTAAGLTGAGMLKRHNLNAGAIDVFADLRTLWMLRRKGELDAAIAAASDSCVRTALGLVR